MADGGIGISFDLQVLMSTTDASDNKIKESTSSSHGQKVPDLSGSSTDASEVHLALCWYLSTWRDKDATCIYDTLIVHRLLIISLAVAVKCTYDALFKNALWTSR